VIIVIYDLIRLLFKPPLHYIMYIKQFQKQNLRYRVIILKFNLIMVRLKPHDIFLFLIIFLCFSSPIFQFFFNFLVKFNLKSYIIVHILNIYFYIFYILFEVSHFFQFIIVISFENKLIRLVEKNLFRKISEAILLCYYLKSCCSCLYFKHCNYLFYLANFINFKDRSLNLLF